MGCGAWHAMTCRVTNAGGQENDGVSLCNFLHDLQAICGDAAWEEALFHCFNRLREKEHKLLICADQNPAQLAIELPDLRSRLATGLIYQLPSMTDALKQQALISHAQSRASCQRPRFCCDF